MNTESKQLLIIAGVGGIVLLGAYLFARRALAVGGDAARSVGIRGGDTNQCDIALRNNDWGTVLSECSAQVATKAALYKLMGKNYDGSAKVAPALDQSAAETRRLNTVTVGANDSNSAVVEQNNSFYVTPMEDDLRPTNVGA
jgi:hypothetical protein